MVKLVSTKRVKDDIIVKKELEEFIMKKKLFIIVGVFALLLSGCFGRGNDNKTGNEDLSGNIYISQRDEKSEIAFEGEEAPVPTSLYTGNGFSIYIPDDEFKKGMDFDDGILEDYWESKANEDAEIHVSVYSGVTSEKAQEHFLKENDDYIFEDLVGMPLCGQEKDGDTLWFFVSSNENNTYIVSWKYPASVADTLGARLAKIAETFQVESK